MTPALRWGLLGTAHINRRLIPAMRAARRSVVAAVASRDEHRAGLYARQWDIPAAYSAYDALLRDPAIDAVYIALPNSLHVEWTLRAVDAGKHVLCEKPLALSADDVDRVAVVARARERVVAEAFMYRHEPLYARVLELLAAQAVGEVRMIAAGFTFLQSRDNDIRLDPALGGGSLWDIGCYPVSAVAGVCGRAPIEAFGWGTRGTTGVDLSFTGMLRFEGDTVATVHSSFAAAYRTWFEVQGTAGILRVANLFRPQMSDIIELRRDDRVERIAVDGSASLFVREVEDFVAAALDGRVPALSLDESRTIAASLAALHRSVELRRPVQL